MRKRDEIRKRMESFPSLLKGQHLVLNEMLLFALGILITAHVVFSFGSIQSSLNEVSTKDQFMNAGDIIVSGVSRAVAENSTVVVNFPEKISGRTYVISLSEDSVFVQDFSNPEVQVSQKLFNIAKSNCITEGVFCLSGEVLSTAGRAEIFIDGKTIKIRRA
ncbi:MAG: hypothetical protein HY368_00515 [Candidatus Aenigmarchaeota archaeon]|nr:hypothetical protein [Candidatus Aenigmarchaeota archaeon]